MKFLHYLPLLFAIVQAKGKDEEKSLYNSTDPLKVLTIKNFYNEVFNKSTAWVIEFYMHWCGHCQKFVPTYLEFAADVAGK